MLAYLNRVDDASLLRFWYYLSHPTAVDPDATIFVVLSYVLFLASLLFMIVVGFRQRSYGMPIVGASLHLAMTIICGFIGPWSAHANLFYDPSTSHSVVWFWRLLFALNAIIVIQYLVYGRSHPHLTMVQQKHFYPISAAILLLSLLLVWQFVIFFQDFYVNDVSPLIVMIIAAGYYTSLWLRPQLRGLSLIGVWLWSVATALLYLGVVLGDMSQPYPDHADTGYGFIYSLYTVTIVLNFAFVAILTRRRRELAHDWNVDFVPLATP